MACLSDAKGPADAPVGERGAGGQVRSTFSVPTNMWHEDSALQWHV